MSQRARGPVGEWWHHKVPAKIIGMYRRIPETRREKWSFGSSTSHLAAANPSWESIFLYGTPQVTLRKRTKAKNILTPAMLLNAYGNGWPDMLAKVTFWSVIKAWFKLALLLPLIIVGMADGPNWETSPPNR